MLTNRSRTYIVIFVECDLTPNKNKVMKNRRLFNKGEKIKLYIAANGRCQSCGNPLGRTWHADHVIPFSAGGATTLSNGAALCRRCNLTEGAKRPKQS